MSEQNTETAQPFRWDSQLDEGGLPVHLPMGVNTEGRGPEYDNEAHHYLCWCGDPKCLLTRALRDAWLSGMRHGLSIPPGQQATR